MASPRTRRILQELKPKDDNNVRLFDNKQYVCINA
jgi:hypothetical protein